MNWTSDFTFDTIKVGDVVSVVNYYDDTAVGVVKEKKETEDAKYVGVKYGFKKELYYVLVEEIVHTEGIPSNTISAVLH